RGAVVPRGGWPGRGASGGGAVPPGRGGGGGRARAGGELRRGAAAADAASPPRRRGAVRLRPVGPARLGRPREQVDVTHTHGGAAGPPPGRPAPGPGGEVGETWAPDLARCGRKTGEHLVLDLAVVRSEHPVGRLAVDEVADPGELCDRLGGRLRPERGAEPLVGALVRVEGRDDGGVGGILRR